MQLCCWLQSCGLWILTKLTNLCNNTPMVCLTQYKHSVYHCHQSKQALVLRHFEVKYCIYSTLHHMSD